MVIVFAKKFKKRKTHRSKISAAKKGKTRKNQKGKSKNLKPNRNPYAVGDGGYTRSSFPMSPSKIRPNLASTTAVEEPITYYIPLTSELPY